jgi:hypothetical protein
MPKEHGNRRLGLIVSTPHNADRPLELLGQFQPRGIVPHAHSGNIVGKREEQIVARWDFQLRGIDELRALERDRRAVGLVGVMEGGVLVLGLPVLPLDLRVNIQHDHFVDVEVRASDRAELPDPRGVVIDQVLDGAVPEADKGVGERLDDGGGAERIAEVRVVDEGYQRFTLRPSRAKRRRILI